MKNTTQRLLLFIIAVPALFASIYFLPQANHLVFNLMILATAYLSSRELMNMLVHRGVKVNRRLLPLLSLPLPAVSYLIISGILDESVFSITLTAVLILVFLTTISSKVSGETFSEGIPFLTAGIFSVIYPGYFLSYIVRLSQFENASLILFFYIFLCYFNDSSAWCVGMLFGKNNKGVFKVSKNKSVAGFIGAFMGTYLMMFLGWTFIPELKAMPLPAYLILTAILSVVTIAGDLVESVIKRSSNVKDSGSFIMGRGGILDSVDSLLLTAPVFYYIISYYAG